MLQAELDQGVRQMNRLVKRNVNLTPLQKRQLAEQQGREMVSRIHSKLVPHLQTQYGRWREAHRFKLRKPRLDNPLRKLKSLFQKRSLIHLDHSKNETFNMTEITSEKLHELEEGAIHALKELSVIEKRSLLDPEKGSSHLIALLVGFLITIPIFFFFGSAGIALGFALTALTVLIIQPIINKVLLGFYFWYGDE
jgi:hypothetical protein